MKIEATTRYGRVRGCAGGPVVVFRGIPYARAPIGRLRLRPPEPPEPWSGVADAIKPGVAALQCPPAGISGVPALAIGAQGEDCLSLNVFTPGVDGARRPVLVWIHGGGFDWGASGQALFDASRLARRGDVVVVTFNYRLGAFGFLQLGALGERTTATPNVGLLDQVAALGFVRENIAAFGGDPENVTAFGESAGAVSIATLLAMPSASGAFDKAILQSGSLQPLHSAESAAVVARELLDELWLDPAAADRIRCVPASSLVLAQTRVAKRLRTMPEWLTYRPFVDGVVVPRDPHHAIRAGAGRGIPMLVGTNRDECGVVVKIDARVRPKDEAGLHARIRELSGGSADPARILAAYARAAAPDARDLVALASSLETDAHFRLPAIRFAEAQAHCERRTFMYRFEWPSPAFGGALGACHGLEVPFVFGRTDAEGLGGLVGDGAEARALAERLMDAWTAFARCGEPGAGEDGAWPVYEESLRATMRIGARWEFCHDPGGIERRAWATPRGDGAARPSSVRGRAAARAVEPRVS